MQTLIGYDLAPFPGNPKLGLEQLNAHCAHGADLRGFGSMPPMAPEAVPVFANAGGETCALIPGVNGSPIPWIPGDADISAVTSTGFLPFEEMCRKHTESNPPATYDRQTIQRAILQIATGLPKKGAPATKSKPAENGKPVEENGAGEGGGPEEPDAGPSLMEHLQDNAGTIAAETAVSALALVLNGAALKPATMMSGLGGSVIGMAAGFAYGKLQPDPDDPTEKWAAYVVGPKLADLLTSKGPLNKFWGTQGPYTAPALRVGDQDTSGNQITHGLHSVNIEGMAAARVGDLVGGSGVAIKMGAKTVLIGGQVAARVDAPLTWGSKSCADAPFLQGARRTFIGGVVNWDPDKDPEADRPEIPQSTLDDSTKVPIDKDGNPAGQPLDYGGVHDPNGPVPTEPGIYFDPVTGEYRIWDQFGIGGWSSTPTELSNLTDIGAIRDIFESDGKPTLLNQGLSAVGLANPEKAGHWYAFGGMFDLGSPTFPGAGNGSLWYIPDNIWGIDMSPYYKSHDWKFNPTSKSFDGLFGWWDQWVALEWGPYKEGAASHGWNPFGQFLQFIYTFSTTVVGFAEHSDAEAKRPRSRS